MRVLVVDLLCNTPYHCAALTRALSEAGHTAELASPRFYLEPAYMDSCPRPAWIHDLVVHASHPRPLRLAVRALEASLNFARLLIRIRARAYDVVHVQWVPFEGRSSPFMRILRAWCDRSGTLLVFTAHNAVPHDRASVDLAAIKRDLDRSHLVVAHSAHVAEELKTEIRTTSPIAVLPLGPQFTDQQLPPRDAAFQRLGNPPRPIVLFQGLIRPYKGLDLLLDAWPEVAEVFPTATLYVVGKLADRASGEPLQRPLSPNVRVVVRYVSVAELLDYYAVADVVVFPYHRISQSAALMTAAGLGRPTVVTPIAGLQEGVEGLRSATVADDVSPSAIARALIASLAGREELATAAESDRLAIASSPIGWPSVARMTADAYDASRRRLGFTDRPL